MRDEDVTKKAGIYPYIVTKEEKHLSIRTFTDNQKREAYERQEGLCGKCGGHFELNEMDADHTTPWSQGGKTISENCVMMCKHCNRTKSDK
jgi:5-methylcytosine-specific restriction endonuclease McrA